MKKIRIAVVGVGGMGSAHAKLLAENPKAELIAVCDTDPGRARKMAGELGTEAFLDHRSLLAKGKPDALTIGTPHYDHPLIAMDALRAGVHVLSEKPMAVTTGAAREALACYEIEKKKNPGLVYGIMFQERTYLVYRKIKELLGQGVLGRLTRATWIHSKWFRSQWYYDHGDWRATWKGEGGGVLLNQCPHTLDMFQWLVGPPDRVTGKVSLGKYHDIEVEDDAHAIFEYDSGLVGHFHANTAECPGTNRLEIIGEMGKLVLEDGVLRLTLNECSTLTYLKETQEGFKIMANTTTVVDLPPAESAKPHGIVLDRFLDAVNTGSAPVARADEGLHSLAMANAIMLSSFMGKTVALTDAHQWEQILEALKEKSRFRKTAASGSMDFADSWKKTA